MSEAIETQTQGMQNPYYEGGLIAIEAIMESINQIEKKANRPLFGEEIMLIIDSTYQHIKNKNEG